MNIGLISIIWRSSILMGAMSDYFIFKTKLKYYHLIGFVMIFICSILIVIDNNSKNINSLVVEKGDIALWIPCVFTVITPVLYNI